MPGLGREESRDSGTAERSSTRSCHRHETLNHQLGHLVLVPGRGEGSNFDSSMEPAVWISSQSDFGPVSRTGWPLLGRAAVLGLNLSSTLCAGPSRRSGGCGNEIGIGDLGKLPKPTIRHERFVARSKTRCIDANGNSCVPGTKHGGLRLKSAWVDFKTGLGCPATTTAGAKRTNTISGRVSPLRRRQKVEAPGDCSHVRSMAENSSGGLIDGSRLLNLSAGQANPQNNPSPGYTQRVLNRTEKTLGYLSRSLWSLV